MTHDEIKKYLLSNPDKLKLKKPFTRGYCSITSRARSNDSIRITDYREATLPDVEGEIVTQDTFIRELDPMSHDVLFDENIPSICVKTENGYRDIKFHRISVPFQKLIKDKQVLHITGNPLQFTLMDTNPDETQQNNFIQFKQYWDLRNQDGMKNKMVDVQKSYGDAGLLYYFDYKGRIKSRILSYADGYVLCPHKDDNGDMVLASVYYCKDGVEYIDSYDDKYMYRFTNKGAVENGEYSGWIAETPLSHGFDEIPLIIKRGNVAWEGVQSIIETYEVIYNVFNAIQKRYGWGILYIKGKFGAKAQKLAGNVILNDASLNENGDAKFLTPPSPQNMLETLESLEESIQKGSGTTFILPKDVRVSGDISGVAIMLTMSLDIENALQASIEWQNVADKMTRLFSFGLAKELVNNGENPTAVTEFPKMHIHANFKIWKPLNDYEYNQMITILTGAGILSKETGIELNTLSKPDEKARVAKDLENAKSYNQNNKPNGTEQNTTTE